MNRKPIILILTSKDEPGGLSASLADAITRLGTHNAVVMSDDKYGSVTKRSAIDRLMDNGGEYRYLLERKDRGVMRERLKPRKFSKRVNRIKNMLKRFQPEYILCTTPYAHHCAVDAKRRLKFNTHIIYMLPSFTMPKHRLDEITSVYIVENSDIKADLVRTGIRSKNILTMGFAYDIRRRSEEEIAYVKQELGLPRMKSIFVNISNAKTLENVFSLLLDQGDVASLVVLCENPKAMQILSSMSVQVPDVTVLFVQSQDKVDEYLSVCDMAITDYDISVIYKCFKLGIPPLIYSKDENQSSDIDYLENHGLCVRTKEYIDIIGLEYKLLQSELANEIGVNGLKWVEMSTLENIANFLVSYIAM